MQNLQFAFFFNLSFESTVTCGEMLSEKEKADSSCVSEAAGEKSSIQGS